MSDEEHAEQPPELPDDVEALKAALAQERSKHGRLLNDLKRQKVARQELSERLKSWNALEESDGLTPERAQDLARREREGQLERARGESGGAVDKLLDQQRQRYEAALAERDEKLTHHARTIEALTIDQTLNTELAKLVDPRLLKAAALLHRGRIKLIEDPEHEQGLRPVAAIDDDYMSVGDYLKTWAENDPEAAAYLKPSLASGGGAQAGGVNGSRRSQKARSQLTPAEKSAIIRSQGLEAYNRLPWK